MSNQLNIEQIIQEQEVLKEYYVYELRDPRDDAVFYVGKGKGRRAEHHEKEAINNDEKETAKLAKIREICARNESPKIVVIGRFESEATALAVEAVMIHWVYGHDSDYEESNLTNIQGGHGRDSIRNRGDYNVIEGIDIPQEERSGNIRMNYPDGTVAFLEHRKVWVGYAEGRIVCTRSSSAKAQHFLKTRHNIDGEIFTTQDIVENGVDYTETKVNALPSVKKSSSVRMNYPDGAVAFLEHRQVWVGYARSIRKRYFNYAIRKI
ncbi:MAG: GIY-YIG nuclease family protein [Nitrosomonadales bacterium]